MYFPIIKDNSNTTSLMQYCKLHEKDECKILSKTEEQQLINEWKDKDENQLRQLLIMHNIALVFKLAASWTRSTKSYDDLVQNGLYGLCLAAKKFDLNQSKTKFASYAYMWIYKYIYQKYSDENKKPDVINESISLNSLITDFVSTSKNNSENGTINNYLENHLDPSYNNIENVEKNIEYKEMQNLYKDMQKYILTSDFNNVDRVVFNGVFVDNQKLTKISSENDIPLNEVKNSYKNVLKKMKNKLASEFKILSFDQICNEY